ncbi:protein TIFY 5A-like [Arachis stenosperma]|uniref:protein TIFY 5A-like n=1 Tax=Arachis stenosperma TaxID=217475 RepID=UPI0025AC674B|nr:protein TIFY 5A-like [Arachis stenosperma]
MRRNCNLELRLFPSPASDHRSMEEEEAGGSESRSSPLQGQHTPQSHPLTIFYDGKISVCDVTHSQARSILMLARKELEERVRTPTSTGSSVEPCSPALLQSSSQQQQYYNNNLHSPGSSLSMKRSLQRFLQKRKNRLQEASPYHH